MKKLAIMFVMLLGSVATMQAQSFDFSCVVDGDINNDGTEASAPVINLEAYSEEQLSTLSYAGFQEGVSRAGDPILTGIAVGYSPASNPSLSYNVTINISSQPSGFSYDIHDADGNVTGQGIGYFKITGFNFTPLYDATVEGIIVQALALVPDPDADDNNDGFTNGEGGILGLALFEFNSGNYQLISNQSIVIYANPDGTFDVIDEDEGDNVVINVSLQEAIDAALAYASS